MARTVNDIFEEIKKEAIKLATEANNNPAITMFNNTSKVAIWRILFYAIAYICFTVEVIFDNTVGIIQNMIANLAPHTLKWYRNKALNFQYGFNLIADTDKYDNNGYSNDAIDNSKIVAYAAFNEASIDNVRSLLIKVAKKQNNAPTQLSPTEEAAFIGYIEKIKDAGVRVVVYNKEADLVRVVVNVYYNPLLLDSNGNRLDGLGGKPVEDTAKQFPFQLDFNGEFIVAQFIDTLQNSYGVSRRRVDLVSLEKKTGTAAYTNISSSFVPDAGYAKYDVDGLVINYIADVSA